MARGLVALEREIIACERCPRLRAHCVEVARVKRRAYRHEEYWGRPVPGFGDPNASLYVLGLAPGAHGANRTGRVFTGDSSGDWLYRALWQTGFANQPSSVCKGDGLKLRDCWIGAAVRCAPPDNKPDRREIDACRVFFVREIELLGRVRCVVALGRVAFASYLAHLRCGARFEFAHGAVHAPGNGLPVLICSYHPSRQNTSTGRLTGPMLRSVFETARRELDHVRMASDG